MMVKAIAGNMYRVSLPNGNQVFIRASNTESIISEISSRTAAMPQHIRSHPSQDAFVMGSLIPGEEFDILGHYNNFWLIKTVTHHSVWLQMTAEIGGAKLTPDI